MILLNHVFLSLSLSLFLLVLGKMDQRSAFCLGGTKITDYPDLFQEGSDEELYIYPLLIISFKNVMQINLLDFLYRIWPLVKG